jgi:hypothetical protein
VKNRKVYEELHDLCEGGLEKECAIRVVGEKAFGELHEKRHQVNCVDEPQRERAADLDGHGGRG